MLNLNRFRKADVLPAAYQACSLSQRWISSAPRWPGCTGDSSCRSDQAGSESQPAGGCPGPGASPAASDTPGNPPTPECNFLKRGAAIKDGASQQGDLKRTISGVKRVWLLRHGLY